MFFNPLGKEAEIECDGGDVVYKIGDAVIDGKVTLQPQSFLMINSSLWSLICLL